MMIAIAFQRRDGVWMCQGLQCWGYMGSDMCQIKRAKLLRKRTKKYIDKWEKHSENKKQSTK